MASSLVVTASDFSSGFANIAYPLNFGGGGLAIRFDSLDPIATTLVGDPGEIFLYLTSGRVGCGAPEVCRTTLLRDVGAGATLARAGRGPFVDGNYTEYYSDGTPIYSYTVAPEPSATRAWAALTALAGLRRRSRASAR